MMFCDPRRLKRFPVYVFLLPLLLLSGLSLQGQTPQSSDTFIAPASISVHAAEVMQFSVARNGAPRTDGWWYSGGVGNVGDAGWIDGAGLYRAPLRISGPTQVEIGYFLGPVVARTIITITNPRPVPGWINVTSFTQLQTHIQIRGGGFVPNSVISVQGKPMPTTYVGGDWLEGTAILDAPVSGPVAVTVTNPDPGSSSATLTIPGVFPDSAQVSPSRVTGGWVTLNLTGKGYTPATTVQMDGRPMQVTLKSATALTAYGYLPPWKSGSTVVTVLPQAGSTASATMTLPIDAAPVSYDVAARFTRQAAFGPRPGLVEHIQQVGLQGFLDEQAKLPGVTYPSSLLPRYPYLQAVAGGGSLLRLRVAMALQSFIVNQAISQEYQSYAPWERKLETDSLGSFRQLMTDIVSDARMAGFLNLAGNNFMPSAGIHPNQNFSREFMQLFTLGVAKLNEDGTVQRDGNGVEVPTYDQNTINDFSRALTGWDYGPVVDPQYTAFGIDHSQPMAAHDNLHDHGAKTLFGTVTLPAGQDITTDRTTALDAIFNHPNLPPFLATRLITQLVTSNPSPAYVKRISAVFKDNGKGVRGDMTAVVEAILMDPEARAGDAATVDVGANDGVLQDPVMFEAFVMNVLQQTQWDGQVTYLPGRMGEDFWHPNSVFGFFPPSFQVPGTTINSPQFSLLNNLTQLHRSQYLYGMIAGTTSGFMDMYQANSWLYTAFTNVPDLVEGLNHQLFSGKMPAATRTAILNYCAGIPDQKQAFTAAIFLAMNSDSINVMH